MIFAGGPWSNRHTSGPNLMASFAPLDPVARIALAQAPGQLAAASTSRHRRPGQAGRRRLHQGRAAKQDKILATASVSTFTALLFEHTIEGLYATPEYGGNRGLVGWQDIGFPGDIQPRGYTATRLSAPTAPTTVADAGVVADVLKLLGAL